MGFGNGVSSNGAHHYQHGQVVFTQGDAANALFRIQSGHVKLMVAGQGEKSAAIALLGVGECFGEGCLAGNSFRSYTATSVRHSTLGRVSKRDMARRLRREPALARLFTSHLLRRLGRVQDDLGHQLTSSSERRLARLLLQLSDLNKLSGRVSLPLQVDQGTLAQVVGTTRSRVSYFMNQFRKKGLITYNGSLKVHPALRTFLNRRTAASLGTVAGNGS